MQLTSEVKKVKKHDKDGKLLLVPEWPERSWETRTFSHMGVRHRERNLKSSTTLHSTRSWLSDAMYLHFVLWQLTRDSVYLVKITRGFLRPGLFRRVSRYVFQILALYTRFMCDGVYYAY